MGEKIDSRAVYAGLWQCRDFEIDHVWQRAVFLSAFLLACYAGYGSIILGLTTADKVRVTFPLVNAICFFVGFIGLLLSLIWIMMAKGSKAWYEHYEAALMACELNSHGAFERSCHERVQQADKAIRGFKVPQTSSWLWNTKGGAFSVAKINIVIGHVSTVIWLFIVGIHIIAAKNNFKSFGEAKEWALQYCSAWHLVTVCGFGLLLFWLYWLVAIKSSFLKDHS